MPRSLRPFGKQRRFGQMPTRLQTQVKNNLGIIMTDQMNRARLFRSEALDTLDQYYEQKQYDSLIPWEEAAKSETYVPVRERQPRIKYNVAKLVVDKVAAKLVGTTTFPKFVVEDDPEDTEFFRAVQKATSFRRNLLEPMKQCLKSGSVFVRFFVVEGQMEMEWANSKYCYPKFDPIGELEQLEIKYVYEDVEDKDANGKFKKKWYRLVLTKMEDILYDTPEYREGAEPQFQEVERNAHGLGWVQGEWLRTSKHKFDCDGDSLFGDVLDFIDDLNYSLSQSSQAVSYNQEPQLAVNNIDEDELDKLIRSSQKAWNLGREGKAEFVQSDLKGVEQAELNRDHNRNRMLDVIRVVLHDPEKIVGNAQSGKALEILYAPLVELIDELRTVLEGMFRNLLIKMGMTLLALGAQGLETVLTAPAGYAPNSLDITVVWPALFPPTLDDLLKKSQICSALGTAMVISRESLTRWIAPDLGIEDVEEEIAKIAAEPPIPSPFGTF